METEKKAFDSSVSFMFFGTWVKAIEEVKKSLGESAAFCLYSAIANYSMYDIEPDFSDYPMLNIVLATVENHIDQSVAHRKRGFAKDEFNENYQAIKAALIANPGASLREIASLVGVDKNMVDRVKKKYSSDIEAAISARGNVASNDPISSDSPNTSSYAPNSSSDSSIGYSSNHSDSLSNSMGQDKTGQTQEHDDSYYLQEAYDGELPF